MLNKIIKFALNNPDDAKRYVEDTNATKAIASPVDTKKEGSDTPW